MFAQFCARLLVFAFGSHAVAMLDHLGSPDHFWNLIQRIIFFCVEMEAVFRVSPEIGIVFDKWLGSR